MNEIENQLPEQIQIKPSCDKPSCDKPSCDKPSCDKPSCDNYDELYTQPLCACNPII